MRLKACVREAWKTRRVTRLYSWCVRQAWKARQYLRSVAVQTSFLIAVSLTSRLSFTPELIFPRVIEAD